ncbi:MAG TPA: hypothetical protein PKK06_01405 [Phycisphaerae bacterium]|nr:hypothetical protein [Phycisphaerae bacterium]HNU46645.1 hypothetical protein [Phycisphaerae bacterium]
MFAQPLSPRARVGALIIGTFIVLSCLKVWVEPGSLTPMAVAQIPDSGLQRQQLLDEARRTNQLLSDILQTLKTQTLNVRMEGADKKPEAPKVPRPANP